MTALWREEHGDEFDVPAAIEERLVDTSWSNDACPHFTDADGRLEVWVHHPDPAKRGEGWPTPDAVIRRFVGVVDSMDSDAAFVFYEGDDVDELFRVIETLGGRVK